jgi:hypothetical protein
MKKGIVKKTAESLKSTKSVCEKEEISIHWFRKGLRLHDNPSLVEAASFGSHFLPIFIIDPTQINPEKVL